VDAMREAAANFKELTELTRLMEKCGAEAEAEAEEAEEAAAEGDAKAKAKAKALPPPTATYCRALIQMFDRCAPVLERKERTLEADDRKFGDSKLPASRPVVTEAKKATLMLARQGLVDHACHVSVIL
jgi:hypothetical protein